MQNKKILVICPYPLDVAAGQRLKYEQYFNSWRENGYEIDISSFIDLDTWKILHKNKYTLKKIFSFLISTIKRLYLFRKLHHYDIIYVFMWVTPIGTTFSEFIVRILSKKLVYDFDDSIHLKDSQNNRKGYVNYFKNSNKSNFLIKHSEHVIISSPFHKKYCLSKNKFNKCTYIPCSLNTDYFIEKIITNKNNIDKITIGWTGTFSSIKYINSIKNVLYKLNNITDFKLIIIGNFEYDLEGIDMEVIEWSKKNEISDLHKIDIGIYPLIKETWSLGKGALKAIQYMSMGIPTIATNYGVNKMLIEHNHNGFLVDTEEEWIKYLLKMINYKQERARIGINARKTILKFYSTDVNKSKYLDVLNNI